jgi:hypothetical protein
LSTLAVGTLSESLSLILEPALIKLKILLKVVYKYVGLSKVPTPLIQVRGWVLHFEVINSFYKRLYVKEVCLAS